MKQSQSEPKKYVETIFAQSAKKAGRVCGDYVVIDRTTEATTAILADGIGTGIKARVAAVLSASRLMELIRLGFTLREACRKMVDTMHEARTKDIPFSAFSVCRILNNGHATIVSYEIPSPVLINNHLAAYLPDQRFFPMGLEMIGEVNCTLDYGDGIMMVSDGVSQAGLGYSFHMGWGIQGACDFINGCLVRGIDAKQTPEEILHKVKEISGSTYGDDTTCLLLLCREAETLNIFTGPPGHRSKDRKEVTRFLQRPGKKVVCGSTTSEIVGRILGVPVMEKNPSSSFHIPPSYEIKGVDYAFEGAATLNQVYNILEEREDRLDPDSSVSDLYRLFHESDTINFVVGTAINPGHQNIVFRQMGIFPREVIIRLLAEKLRKLGKLVNVEYI
jgi:predicted transcriptional regulator